VCYSTTIQPQQELHIFGYLENMQGEFGAISDQSFAKRVRGLGEQRRATLSCEFGVSKDNIPTV